jgi:hypothetical protein
MTCLFPVADIEMAREFRLQCIEGSAVEALAHPALRLCLANCARLRRTRPQNDQPKPDGKRLAAGDFE